MKYTYQEVSESGSFASPMGDDIGYAYNKGSLEVALDSWEYQHQMVGSRESDAALLVWKGIHEDIADLYPDWIVNRGPRGGFRMERI